MANLHNGGHFGINQNQPNPLAITPIPCLLCRSIISNGVDALMTHYAYHMEALRSIPYFSQDFILPPAPAQPIPWSFRLRNDLYPNNYVVRRRRFDPFRFSTLAPYVTRVRMMMMARYAINPPWMVNQQITNRLAFIDQYLENQNPNPRLQGRRVYLGEQRRIFGQGRDNPQIVNGFMFAPPPPRPPPPPPPAAQNAIPDFLLAVPPPVGQQNEQRPQDVIDDFFVEEENDD